MFKRSSLLLVVALAIIVAIVATFYPETPQDKAKEAKPLRNGQAAKDPPDIIVEETDAAKASMNDDGISKQALQSNDVRSSYEAHTVEVSTVYDVVFDRDGSGPLSKVHDAFEREQRNESWANAMEEGIRLSIDKSAEKDWAKVESVECRATMCEVAGYILNAQDSLERDPRDLFPDDFEVGWWQGQGPLSMPLRRHSYEEEGITRFLIIIADNDAIERAAGEVP